jgi:D-aspartate ligase
MVDECPRQPVFILGGRFPALGTLHSLAARGVSCWVCESRRLQATWSRFARYWRLPDPRRDERGMVESLLTLAQKVGGRPVLIPTADHYARALSRNRHELDALTVPCIASDNVVELLVDKRRFYGWAQANGVSCPRTTTTWSTPDPPLHPPLVAKPVNFADFLANASQMSDGRKASDLRFTLLRTDAEWRDFRDKNQPNLHHLLLQEYVNGTSADMYSIGIYADRDSRIIGLFVGRKLRGYPALYGNMVLGQNDFVPPEIINEVTRIVNDLRYTGIAEFEYLREPVSGKFRLIEINPRCWSWIGATSMSRADIPWIAYRDLCCMKIDPVFENGAPGSIKAVRVMSDIVNVFWRYGRDSPGWLMTPRAWWRSLRAQKLMIIEFERGDWPVSFFCFVLLLRDIVKKEH